MNRRRLTVALVAATATGLALVTPVQAEEASGSSLSSDSSLSSTSEDLPEGIPPMLGSAVVTGDTKLVLDTVQAVMMAGALVTKVAAFATPYIPNGEAMLRNALRSIGVQV
ncbi:hypothetical protein HCH15_07470 [Corynebacterium testudinoris]|uniref:Uncharacterized protein n=1 Tax=Corynebacterium testudinoris TaxID=136857 RepID=A0A0G3H769_9CORY|nr:hypothetical protein [Corynebacterium testudinoris]AKK09194.1 hypothetical protein CTEST_08820 [Corynebacterium testudinoris]MBX8996023.1 hypothetical protein [Corynebacterium testudinoris]